MLPNFLLWPLSSTLFLPPHPYCYYYFVKEESEVFLDSYVCFTYYNYAYTIPGQCFLKLEIIDVESTTPVITPLAFGVLCRVVALLHAEHRTSASHHVHHSKNALHVIKNTHTWNYFLHVKNSKLKILIHSAYGFNPTSEKTKAFQCYPWLPTFSQSSAPVYLNTYPTFFYRMLYYSQREIGKLLDMKKGVAICLSKSFLYDTKNPWGQGSEMHFSSWKN